MEAHVINWIIISLCAGCLALEVKPVTDPVISKVGDSVQLQIKPPGVLAAVIWSFSPANIPVVSWVGFNPVIAPGYVNRVTLNTATGSVELRSVSLSDAGVYAFQGLIEVSGNAEHINGKVTLEVYEPITNVNVKPSPAQPIANQALKLTCEVLGSQTVSSRLWLKDGQPLSTSDRITLSVDSSVVSFNPVLQSDNGEYQCKASNPLSEVTSAGYRLEVNYGPEQASITAPHSGAKGSSVTFTCSAQSLPPCNYTWYFNGADAVQSSQYKIASVSNADSGNYTCVAWNSVTGRNTSVVKLFTVTAKDNLTPGEIAGIVIGTLAGVALIGVIVYFCLKKYGNGTKTPKPSPPGNKSPAAAVNANDKADNIHYADPKFLKNNKSGQRIQMEETTTEYAQVAGRPAGNQRQPPLEPNTEYAQVAGRPAGKNRPAV